MRTQSEDTSPEIERVQIELIRKASPAKIFNLVRSMSQTMMQASRENIQRLHPGASKEELTLIFIELYYGKELANFVRAKMERRGGERIHQTILLEQKQTWRGWRQCVVHINVGG